MPEKFKAVLRSNLNARSTEEVTLVDRLASHLWLIRCLEKAAQVLTKNEAKRTQQSQSFTSPAVHQIIYLLAADENTPLGSSDARKLMWIQKYQLRLDVEIFRCLRDLNRAQRGRAPRE